MQQFVSLLIAFANARGVSSGAPIPVIIYLSPRTFNCVKCRQLGDIETNAYRVKKERYET